MQPWSLVTSLSGMTDVARAGRKPPEEVTAPFPYGIAIEPGVRQEERHLRLRASMGNQQTDCLFKSLAQLGALVVLRDDGPARRQGRSAVPSGAHLV
ncbi:hypothetical protein Sliba_35330 [Streptomyces nigrescens]|uniref:Uncharacterized protein n=1 Tax=Streptomyces nigrescens TaxID=1920 RepID=A0A640TIP0_STRNI|nr:hypothetical protein Sliba_35330 [Streptomyces libani subsp. libani]GGV92101.1 hypothetical protein GCM10010500_24030 [Streptomyces libani subsp. libani]